MRPTRIQGFKMLYLKGLNSVMWITDHFKNGTIRRDVACHISTRGRFLRYFAVVALAVSAAFTSCKKDDGDKDDGKVPDELIPAAISEVFRELMPIYSGITPPDISGEYLSTPQLLKGSSQTPVINWCRSILIVFSRMAMVWRVKTIGFQQRAP